MLEGLFIAAYVVLFLLFLGLMALLGREFPSSISGTDLLLLCLATFRLTELITSDSITRFLRDPFVWRRKVVRPDGTQDVEVKPAGQGLRRKLGELLICPWCSGVWAATALTYFYLLSPGVARVLLIALAAAGAGILLGLLGKLLDRSADRP